MRAHLAAIGCNGQEISWAHLAAIGCNGLRTFLFFICNKPNVVTVASHVGYVQQKPQCLWWKYSVGCRNPSQWFQHTYQQFKSVFWAIRMLVVQPCKNSFMFYKNITHFIGSTIVYVTRMKTELGQYKCSYVSCELYNGCVRCCQSSSFCSCIELQVWLTDKFR